MDGFWLRPPKIDHAEQLLQKDNSNLRPPSSPKSRKKVKKNLDAFFTKKEASNLNCPFVKVVQHGRFWGDGAWKIQNSSTGYGIIAKNHFNNELQNHEILKKIGLVGLCYKMTTLNHQNGTNFSGLVQIGIRTSKTENLKNWSTLTRLVGG